MARVNHPRTEDVVRCARRLLTTVSYEEDRWVLENLPFTLAELGYSNLHNPETPGRIAALSLREADHYLRLCESRIREARWPDERSRDR